MSWEFTGENLELDLESDVLAKPFWAVARKNARLMASLMEPVLCHLFKNLTAAENANDFYDLLLDGKHTVEVRTITDKTQISFESSSNVGAGRDGVNKQATIDKLTGVDRWIFCNVSKFPEVAMHTFTGNQVRSYCAKHPKVRKQYGHTCLAQILKEPK